MSLFAGPKLQAQLEEISEKLVLTVDYGWLTVLAQPLFWLLSKIHDLLGNWGWSIIAVTALIQAGVLQANRDQRTFHGENAQAPAENEGAAGALQRRPPGIEPSDDGPV